MNATPDTVATQVVTQVQTQVQTTTTPRRNPIEDALRAELGVSRPSRAAAFHWADVVQLNISRLEGKLSYLMANKPFENAPTIKVVKSMLDAWKSIPPELVRTPAATQVQTPAQSQAPSESLESQLRALTGCKRPSAQTATHYREFVAEQMRRLLDFACEKNPFDELCLLAMDWHDEWKAIPADKLIEGRKLNVSPGDSGGPMNVAPLNYSRFPLATFMSERNIAFLGRDWPLANALDVDILKDAEVSACAMMERINDAGQELYASDAFAAYTEEARTFADNKLASAYDQWRNYAIFLNKRAAFRVKEDEKRSRLDFNLDGRGAGAGSVESRKRKAAIADESRRVRDAMKNRSGKKG